MPDMDFITESEFQSTLPMRGATAHERLIR